MFSSGVGEGEGVAVGWADSSGDSSEMWEHVQSLYQSSFNSCIYGKNNILMYPVRLMYSVGFIYYWCVVHYSLVLMYLCKDISLWLKLETLFT